MNQTHELKTWPEFFEPLASGAKTFEVRKNDREFVVGDTLVLREFDPLKGCYTGREMTRRVSYILIGSGAWIVEGYCVLGLQEAQLKHAMTATFKGRSWWAIGRYVCLCGWRSRWCRASNLWRYSAEHYQVEAKGSS